MTTQKALSGDGCEFHVFNDGRGEGGGADLGGAGHHPFEIVGDFLLLNGAGDAVFDQLGGFVPAEEFEHHRAGEHYGAGIDDVLVGVFWRSAMGCFEYPEAIANVRAWRHAKSANLCSASIGKIVAVQV